MRELLQVQDLTKTFQLSAKQQKLEKTKEKVRVAVNHLSFTAYEGEIFGLLGPNGAGKTTTLRLLATLIRPDSGDALVDGASVVREPGKVRGRIGFLTSELKLEDCFTPNYLFNFFAGLHKVDPAVRDRRRQELFARFGIDKFAEVKVANLSTGMKQKVSLVVSIVHNPDIIIFDEPTNGLDVLTAKVVTDFLQIAGRGEDHHRLHPHFQPHREAVRPGGGHRQRTDDRLRHAGAGLRRQKSGRPVFEIYKETAGDGE